jgi:hypothetical protein
MNMSAALQEAVTFNSEPAPAHQGSVSISPPGKIRIGFRGPYYTSAYVCRIAPDNYNASIRELKGQASGGLQKIDALVAPNSSAFPSGVLPAGRFRGGLGVRNVRGYLADIDLVSLYTSVPEIPSLQPLGRAPPRQEEGPEERQVALEHQPDLRMLVEQGI